jgi:hypothetical protein
VLAHAHTRPARTYTCSDNLSEIPVGVDPMNFTVRRILRKPTAPAASRMLVGVLAEDISDFCHYLYHSGSIVGVILIILCIIFVVESVRGQIGKSQGEG